MKKFIVTDYGVKTDTKDFQTQEIQKVIDLCKTEGGTVIIPKGEYHIASLRLWSDTTLYLQSGARLIASDETDDYEVFPIPSGVITRSDRDLFPNYYVAEGEDDPHYHKYRKAIISAYGEKNISIIGEENTCIDGSDCFDAGGEEGFRGPHGIYLSNCENITFCGYTIQNTGNFMHQTDNCKNLVFKNITGLAGHDGTHMHFCENVLIENCRFITGDDCIAGANMRNVTVKNCELNTSCQTFRVGGKDIKIENCHMYGPGYYPHRMSIVKGKNNYLPREQGRHNAYYAFIYFASPKFKDCEPHSISFKDCIIENIDGLMYYDCGNVAMLQGDSYLEKIDMENVKISGLLESSICNAKADLPLTINLKNVEVTFREGSKGNDAFGTDKENVRINKI